MRNRTALIVTGAVLAMMTTGTGLQSASVTKATAPQAQSTAPYAVPAPSAPVQLDSIHEKRQLAGGPPVDVAAVGPAQLPTLPTTPPPKLLGAAEVAALQQTDVVLMSAYSNAVAMAPASCHLPVPLLAAIGQVESGSVGGRQIGADHRVTPPIYGPVLDGGGFAAVPDTDHGVLDGDTQWDRAVGPMQFIPSTWRLFGVDGDGDGLADPQNVFDAAASAAAYLCVGGRDLSRPGDLESAVLSYNHSAEYLAVVQRWMAFFASHGLGSIGDVSFTVASSVATPDRSQQAAAALSPAATPEKPAVAAPPASTTASGGPTASTPTSASPTSPASPSTSSSPTSTSSTSSSTFTSSTSSSTFTSSTSSPTSTSSTSSSTSTSSTSSSTSTSSTFSPTSTSSTFSPTSTSSTFSPTSTSSSSSSTSRPSSSSTPSCTTPTPSPTTPSSDPTGTTPSTTTTTLPTGSTPSATTPGSPTPLPCSPSSSPSSPSPPSQPKIPTPMTTTPAGLATMTTKR